MAEKTIWGIHAGRTGDADKLFLKEGYIGLGWPRVGNLAVIKKDREEFKKKVAQAYPDTKPGAIPTTAGELFRFIWEIKTEDIVVYPSKRERLIYFGRIDGDYKYDSSKEESYPNLRPVKWLKSVPRTQFSQGALYEIGSLLSLFQIKNNADEFLAVLEGKPEAKESLLEDVEEVGTITEDIETQTKDFILKQLYKNYRGEDLELLIIHLLDKMGYHARQTFKNSPSVDIIAHKDDFGFEPPMIKCQVKSEEGAIKLEPVEKLYSRVNQNEYGLFITLSTYGEKVRDFAESKHNLRLIDGYELVDIILDYYDELDTKYKNTIPLNKVFLPSSVK